MAGPANRQGRAAADNVCGRPRAYRGTYGTSVLRCFGLTAACVGAGEKALRAAGRAYHAVHVHPRSHAGYYPGGGAMSLKVANERFVCGDSNSEYRGCNQNLNIEGAIKI